MTGADVIPLDPQVALAADPAYAEAKRQEAAELERLRDLEAEQQALTTQLAEIAATAETRKQRQQLRGALSEIGFEVAATQHRIKLRERDVQRVQRVVAAEVGTRIAEQATSAGETIEVKLDDLLAEFAELEALNVLGRTARDLVLAADRMLGEETQAAPTVPYASGLGPAVWQVLVRLREAMSEERQRKGRERLRHR